MVPENFADRLLRAVSAKGTPAVVGIDPRLEMLPEEVLRGGGTGFAEATRAVEVFCREIIDLVAPLVPAVKLQIAFFERLGWTGVRAYGRLIRYAHERGLLVIGDVKRGDIASTASAYAEAHLGRLTLGGRRRAVFDADAVTLNPYLGTDGITPFLQAVAEFGKGVFVLVRTSNPSAGELQHLVADGRPLYLHVAEMVRRWGEGLVGREGYSAVGAVVGARGGEGSGVLAEVRRALPRALMLVPGYGAQGAAAADLRPAFDPAGRGAIVNSSRGIIYAWRRPPFDRRFGQQRWREAVLAALQDMREDLAAVLRNPGPSPPSGGC